MYAKALAVIKGAGFKPHPRNKCFCTQFQWFHCKILMSSPDLLQAPTQLGWCPDFIAAGL